MHKKQKNRFIKSHAQNGMTFKLSTKRNPKTAKNRVIHRVIHVIHMFWDDFFAIYSCKKQTNVL